MKLKSVIKSKRKNKKGLMGIVLFFAALFLILIMAFIGSIVVGIGGWTGNLITPIMQGLGTAGSTNLTQAADSTFVPLNNTVQAFPWLLGFSLVAALVFSIGFAATYTVSPSPFLIGTYFFFVILLIFGSIIMSNTYQNLYDSNDIIGTSLQSQTLTSYLILYSPFIFSLIALITGIYMFSRPSAYGGGI